MSSILDILSPVPRDNSVVGMHLHSYLPNNSSFQKLDEIRIPVQNQPSFLYPHESLLYIEGKLSQIVPETVNKVTLTRNFLLFLFSEIKLEVNGFCVDSIRSPGHAVTMKQYVSEQYGDDALLSEMGSVKLEMKKDGAFSYCIPLKYLMGFFQDYTKIMIYTRMELVFTRSRTDKNCCYHEPAAGGVQCTDINIEILKIAWKMVHVEAKDVYKLKLLKILEKGKWIQLFFRAWDYTEFPNIPTSDKVNWQVKNASPVDRPLFVIVGFQQDRRENVTKDASKFDHCQLTDCRLYLNSQRYPAESLDLDFQRNKFSTAYNLFSSFQSAYYGESGKQKLSMSEYKDTASLIVFDCSNSDPSIKVSSVDIRLEFTFSQPLGQKVTASCLLIHEKIVNYNPFTNLIEKQM